MTAMAQKNAVKQYRQRAAARGIKRIEVQAAEEDRPLLVSIAEALRGEAKQAAAVRAAVLAVLSPVETKPALDVFASDLPDEAFEGIFSRPQASDWRETGL